MSGSGAQMQAKEQEMEGMSVDRMAVISHRIREALRAALPAPPEQFFTVMVPGKVVNFDDFMEGYDADGNPTTAVLPTVTELNHAKLCDDMPALASVQLGPTGRSVSRSYEATLSKLVPKGTTVGVEVADPKNLSDAEQRYNRAMQWLLQEDERNPGHTHLDTYIQKQKAYTAAEEKKIQIFNDAYDKCVKDNTTVSKQREAYDKWVNENGRNLRDGVEGAYKDWVIHGRKEATEYWFAIVDNDSAMSRVEQSKEAMRNNTVMNSDGSVEYPKVGLTPSNWAWIAKKKATSGVNQTESVSQYTWEISRLQKRNQMLEVMKTNPPQFKGPDGDAPKVPGMDEANAQVKEAMKEYLDKRTELDNINRAKKVDKAKKDAAQKALNDARKKLDDANAALDKANVDRLSAVGLNALDELFKKSVTELDGEIKANEDKIKELDAKRQALMANSLGKASDIVAKDMGLQDPPADGSDATNPPVPATGTTASPAAGATGAGTTANSTEDYFTAITVEVSSSYQHTEASQQSTSVSASVSANFGRFGGSVSAAHSQSSADALSQMAKCDVKVSFECMRVDIDRPWLRPELFFDDDLQTAPGALISPGQVQLAALMDPDNFKDGAPKTQQQRVEELQRYSTFPMYPTAFLLACNTVLELSGETAAIQSHFDTSSTTASGSVSYGPITVSASASHSASHQSSTCETTANGCRITIKSPQIIGWISELVPALPRRGEKPSTTPSTAAAVELPPPAPMHQPVASTPDQTPETASEPAPAAALVEPAPAPSDTAPASGGDTAPPANEPAPATGEPTPAPSDPPPAESTDPAPAPASGDPASDPAPATQDQAPAPSS